MKTSNEEFTPFLLLPREIRNLIWLYTLPGPRTLLITRNPPPRLALRAPATAKPNTMGKLVAKFRHERPPTPPQRPRLLCSSKYVVAPVSYGGRHPIILSINRESREEALRHLTPLFNAYWNLEIDAPYFEWDPEEDMLLTREMRLAGELDVFKNLAIDWTIWCLGFMEIPVRWYNNGKVELAAPVYEHPLVPRILNSCRDLTRIELRHSKICPTSSVAHSYLPIAQCNRIYLSRTCLGL